MNKTKTTIVIISVGLFLVLAILASRSLISRSSTDSPLGRSVGVQITEENSPSISVSNQVALNLLSDSDNYIVGDTVEVSVNSDSVFTDIIGTELYVSYDPNVLSFVKAEKGTLFASARELGPEVTDGIVSYGLIIFPGDEPISGEGELALFTFDVVGAGPVEVNLTGDSLVSAVGNSAQNILGSTTGVSITVR